MQLTRKQQTALADDIAHGRAPESEIIKLDERARRHLEHTKAQIAANKPYQPAKLEVIGEYIHDHGDGLGSVVGLRVRFEDGTEQDVVNEMSDPQANARNHAIMSSGQAIYQPRKNPAEA